MPVIEVTNLHKRYGSQVAVRDVSFTVTAGEVFGVLGTNGAGKTTTVECVAGLRVPNGGGVSVLGLDPRADAARLRPRVGVQLQEAQLPDRIRVHEALDLYASFYPRPLDPDVLLDELGLLAQRGVAWRKLSGGQKQRLSIALALVGDPEVALLDELSTGLDPHGRREVWAVVERLRDRGVTILLVTHLMAEAERLCDRVAVIDAGRVVALDTPAALTRRYGGDTLEDAFLALTDSIDGTDGTDGTDRTDGIDRTDGTDRTDGPDTVGADGTSRTGVVPARRARHHGTAGTDHTERAGRSRQAAGTGEREDAR
ncbi:ABC transporter ATP-binding protein [Micromonospora cathayae]|uniref:ABC transporter ATP-binding protein n=1 Tax=Micromonospora cathayae TaxID=3028804 RepID=A0ABY7ZYD4_9ACTN|nr:ABC transporter ATP-binding protein [Micromonospora sp. HUAS 3]WDZ87915.1 ABC transporter ATP-binding protein [Micromonospora sp. HUAS 3]